MNFEDKRYWISKSKCIEFGRQKLFNFEAKIMLIWLGSYKCMFCSVILIIIYEKITPDNKFIFFNIQMFQLLWQYLFCLPYEDQFTINFHSKLKFLLTLKLNLFLKFVNQVCWMYRNMRKRLEKEFFWWKYNSTNSGFKIGTLLIWQY